MPAARDYECWGSHGLEHCTPGQDLDAPALSVEAVSLLEQAYAAAAGMGLWARLEGKPGCVALHWRGLPSADVENMAETMISTWSHFLSPELRLDRFNGGLELRSNLASKAGAIRTLKKRWPDAPMAYLGDDLTDEEAFAELSATDLPVTVGRSGSSSRARAALDSPEELLGFLQRWRESRAKAVTREVI
jgi:trehalose-phosphatase